MRRKKKEGEERTRLNVKNPLNEDDEDGDSDASDSGNDEREEPNSATAAAPGRVNCVAL